MWILECDDPTWKGERKWLRPGSKLQVGRTRDEKSSFPQLFLNDKSVSKKHVYIEVGAVQPGDGLNPQSRSEIVVEDVSKIGTLVNSVAVKQHRHILEGDRHEIKLGRSAYLLSISWQPVVFTLSFSSKELQNKDTLADLDRLEHLDIKYLHTYDREYTTHSLSKKRNTSKNLQALVNGKYIVHQDTFLQAVLGATEAESNSQSPLEKDFDENWPNALEHLPAQGNEETQLDAPAYLPDSARQNIFEGYSFVFCDEGQFKNLLAPITQGGGKAFLQIAVPGFTTVDDFVRYVKGVAGEKGLGEFEDGSEGKGVVFVRYQPKDPNDWYTDFITRVSQYLDHRPIEQSEFLDAILRNDASVLRRPLAPVSSGVPMSSFAEPPRTQVTQLQGPSVSQPNPVVPTAQGSSRTAAKSKRNITSRFKGFDDSSDESDSKPNQSSNVANTPAVIDADSQESSMFVSQGERTQREKTPSQLRPSQSQTQDASSRKRPAPMDESSVMSQLAPATLGLKRRRLADQAARRERGEPSPPPPVIEQPKPEVPKKKIKKPVQEIDVLEIARLQREKEAEQARADRESLKASLENMDINEIRHHIIIEEIMISRPNVPDALDKRREDDPRWEAKWNGRANFKNFKPQGSNITIPRPPKVIVELEPVKKKDHGIGDAYWGESDGQSRRKKKGKGKAKQPAKTPTFSDSSDNDDMDIDDAPRTVSAISQKTSTARSQGTQKLADKTNLTRTSKAPAKRPAAAPLRNPAPAKKAKPTYDDDDDSDDSDDGTKFKFRKK